MQVTKTAISAFDRVWFVDFRGLPKTTQRKIDSVLRGVRKAVGQNGFVGRNRFLHLDPKKLSRRQKPLQKFFARELRGEELDLNFDSTWQLVLTLSERPKLDTKTVKQALIEILPRAEIIDDIFWLRNELWINTSAKPSDAFIASIERILA